MEPRNLEAIGIIKFDGITKNALCLHPDGQHLLYPMGYKVVIKNIETGEQKFLSGHTNDISALCVSPCGEYVASGQNNHQGFKAIVIVWDYKKCLMRGSYEIHKVGVEDLCFTCNSNFLVSIGGRDDGTAIVWDVRNNSPICDSFASNETSGNAYNVARMNVHGEYFVTAGDRTLKIWRINTERRKMHGINMEVGKLKRIINCIVVDENDEIMYCGTSSGDIIKARTNLSYNLQCEEPTRSPVMIGCYSKITRNMKKMKAGEGDLYAGGIKTLLLLKDERLVVGAGDGTVELIEIMNRNNQTRTKPSSTKLPNTPQIFTHRTENVCSAVTSMILRRNQFILVGTIWCEIYQIQLSNFHMCLLITSHATCIYSIAFPRNRSDIFATGSKNDFRLWKLKTQKEILRITVPNFVCSSLQFTRDDQMLLSAWNDGMIRAFAPHNGQLYFAIHNAHTKAVSTIAVADNGARLISGGCDGQVRIWEIKADVQRLVTILKEHRGPITSLHVSPNNEDLISSSTDGTCIIWDIIRYVRKHILLGNTLFMMAQFTLNGLQILTCGTDRKIAYWETLDCSLIREIEGSSIGTLNCLDISPNGRSFVTGSNDCTVKIWEYNSADITHISISHAAVITACKFSPNGKHIITTSADGTIMIWNYPYEDVKDSTSTVRTGKTDSCESTHNSQDENSHKLSLRKSKDDVGNATPESVKKSLVSCMSNNQKQLSTTSDQSKGSKKKNEKVSVCKCASRRSIKSKLNVNTQHRCQCSNVRNDVSSDKAQAMHKSKESLNMYSRKF